MNKIAIAAWDKLEPLVPVYAMLANVDLVITRFQDKDEVSVLYGRCHHRGALLADGHIQGDDLICGLHNWDYNYKSGVSAYNNEEKLHKFTAWVEDGQVWVDEDEIKAWEIQNPQPYNRDAYQGLYQDVHGGPEEPHAQYIQHLAEK